MITIIFATFFEKYVKILQDYYFIFSKSFVLFLSTIINGNINNRLIEKKYGVGELYGYSGLPER